MYAHDNKGRSALHYASRTKDRFDFVLSKAPELLDLPDFEGKTPLHHALGHLSHWGRNDPSVVYALIAAGADVTHPDHNGKTALHIALDNSSWRIHEDGSVWGSGRDTFDRLVGKGADVNARTSTGEPPIFAYIRSGQLSAATDLSQLGPRPKKGQPDFEWDSAKDRLERASAVEREDAVWAFVEQQGVDLQAVNDAGEGLLHLIAQEPRGSYYEDQYRGIGVARFKTLMAKGLDPAMEDRQHRTPLDLAASFGKEDILALFKTEDE
jgi:ankyrin repeat protein